MKEALVVLLSLIDGSSLEGTLISGVGVRLVVSGSGQCCAVLGLGSLFAGLALAGFYG